MNFTKKQEREVNEILDRTDDEQLIKDLVYIRSLILMELITPMDKALFTSDLLTFEALRRGLKL